jgi:hypothetical protein
MLIYIHGYGSNGLSNKARHYQRLFGRDQVFAPSLPTESRLAIDTLQQVIELNTERKIGLIGSSLGGYWAVYLAERYGLPAVLINPAIPPWGRVETMTRPGDFHWHDDQLKRLQPFRVESPSTELQTRLCLLQQMDDEVLNPLLALQYLPQAEVHTGEGGGHRMNNVADYDSVVKRFFESNGCLDAKITAKHSL